MTGDGSAEAVFVYGTLRPRAKAFDVVAEFVERAESGRLVGHRLLGRGHRYPWCVASDSEDDAVAGDVLWLSAVGPALERLDRYERAVGPDPEYRRVLRPVLVAGGRVECWLYVGEAVPTWAEAIPGGDWLAG